MKWSFAQIALLIIALFHVIQAVIGFIIDQKGLMYNLTLEGSKISRINP